MKATAGRVLWCALLMLPVAAQAAAPTADELAAQVNAQIVRQHVNQGVAMMAGESGAGFLPHDLPAACKPAMEAAVASMSAELVRYMQETFNDPAYQRSFEQLLGKAYTPQQLQAFLERRGSEDLGVLNEEVMSPPGLQAAQDAHMAQLTEAADTEMDADPGLDRAMAGVRSAQARCDDVRMEQEAP